VPPISTRPTAPSPARSRDRADDAHLHRGLGHQRRALGDLAHPGDEVAHAGKVAGDAVELMNVGVNYMREHMPSDARVHYAYLDTGGIAPNARM
jgi:hypothetical protein